MTPLVLELAPRALRDLKRLPTQEAEAILDDLEPLRVLPWPGPPKVKRVKGTPYAKLRTGAFRSIVRREGRHVIVLRVVARQDLERVLKGL